MHELYFDLNHRLLNRFLDFDPSTKSVVMKVQTGKKLNSAYYLSHKKFRYWASKEEAIHELAETPLVALLAKAFPLHECMKPLSAKILKYDPQLIKPLQHELHKLKNFKHYREEALAILEGIGEGNQPNADKLLKKRHSKVETMKRKGLEFLERHENSMKEVEEGECIVCQQVKKS